MLPETATGTFEDIFKEDLVEDGTYHLRVANIRVREGDPAEEGGPKEKYVSLDQVITGNHEKGLGRHIFQNIPLKPGEMWMLREILKKCNVDPETVKTLQLTEESLKSIFVGLEYLGAVITYDTKRGGKRNRVQRVMSLTSSV